MPFPYCIIHQLHLIKLKSYKGRLQPSISVPEPPFFPWSPWPDKRSNISSGLQLLLFLGKKFRVLVRQFTLQKSKSNSKGCYSLRFKIPLSKVSRTKNYCCHRTLNVLILPDFYYFFFIAENKFKNPLVPYLCLTWNLPDSCVFPKWVQILCMMKRDTFIQK